MAYGLEKISKQLQEFYPDSIHESKGLEAARTLASLFELLVEIQTEQKGNNQ